MFLERSDRPLIFLALREVVATRWRRCLQNPFNIVRGQVTQWLKVAVDSFTTCPFPFEALVLMVLDLIPQYLGLKFSTHFLRV